MKFRFPNLSLFKRVFVAGVAKICCIRENKLQYYAHVLYISMNNLTYPLFCAVVSMRPFLFGQKTWNNLIENARDNAIELVICFLTLQFMH